ncbi:IS2 transposase TnpB [Stieleria varia]|uniref:IS2 transposase TnpB n=2 Tax=Stieleria varia TaxID=2528005 RepID=A0A5C6ATQ3_9BACT|nr:IS2 transposase TnpB [Stieleria varia]
MMLDADIVAVSPSSVYRVLRDAGAMDRFNGKKSKKGTGFKQPVRPHDHWHLDISYLNICGTFFFMCSVLDGCSRSIIHWEIREKMEETDVEIILQRARENHPDAKPRIITDNGPKFISRDFKEFIRIAGMTHGKTSPYYPQSNGKIERYHRTIKGDCIRESQIKTVDDARRIVKQYVQHYNEVRLHSAIGYVTPLTKLAGEEKAVFDSRDRKLEAARETRRLRRQQQAA